ncbi:MAG TPA: ankyrin repeat domain-containing protein, partial [Sphingomonadales bacterium]
MKRRAFTKSLLVAAAVLVGMGASLPAVAQFSPTFELLKALKKNDVYGIKSNALKGANVNARDDDGNPAIHIAAAQGQASVVKFLLEQGAHVD